MATASKDESLRLWNMQSGSCVAIFAGHRGHRDAVISVGFHPLGNKLVSGGMDNSIKIWNLESEKVSKALELSRSAAYNRPRLIEKVKIDSNVEAEAKKIRDLKASKVNKSDNLHNEIENENDDQEIRSAFPTVFEQVPCFSTQKIHTDYVDCVEFVGDLIISKSSMTNSIVLWKPDVNEQSGTGRIHDQVCVLREFQLGRCDVWFIRFQTDYPEQKVLVIGNQDGEVKLWRLGPSLKEKHDILLTHHLCNSTIRMVSFSPDRQCLIAVCDDSSVFKWDAITGK